MKGFLTFSEHLIPCRFIILRSSPYKSMTIFYAMKCIIVWHKQVKYSVVQRWPIVYTRTALIFYKYNQLSWLSVQSRTVNTLKSLLAEMLQDNKLSSIFFIGAHNSLILYRKLSVRTFVKVSCMWILFALLFK